MNVMATEAGDAARIHEAGNEVVALHAILVGSPVGEMGECCVAEFVLLQFPEIVQTLAHMEADRPVIRLSCGGSGQGLPLRMALNAGVGCVNVIEARRIHDIRRRWLLHVIAAGAVTLFAAHVPFRNRLGLNVVVDGMTAVAEGTSGALHVVFGIIFGPPVRPRLYVVGAPDLVSHVPLGGQREIIIAYLLKVPLLPFATVNQGDIILLKM